MKKILVFLAIFLPLFILALPARAAYLYLDSYGNLSFTTPGLPAGRQVLGEAASAPEVTAPRPLNGPLPVAPAGKIQIERVGDQIEVLSPLGREQVEAIEGVEVVEIEESAQMRGVKVRVRGDALEIEHRRIGALTHFPLSVNTETNELTVTTPTGSRVVTVLPDQAVANMLQSNIFDFLLSQRPPLESFIESEGPEGPTGIVAPEPETPEVVEDIELAEEAGVLTYRMRGVKQAKFLGFLPFQFLVEAAVSAETGELVSLEQPSFYRFFGFLFSD